MFENTTHFDFDDDDALLNTSFNPASSSTQTRQVEKRNRDEFVQENPKKIKLANNEQSVSLCFEEDKLSNFSFNSPNIVKRRFPGPAGLLPERLGSNKSILELASEKLENEESTDMLLCSQQTVTVFEEGPWKEMTKDFRVLNGECLYQKFNIKWIKKEASLKKLLINHKAPFLAAIIQSLEILGGKMPTVNVTLKDSTGDIQGSILHSLYEEYSNFFTIGSVLVLKQFGVLSAGYKNHCLTITPNNLLTIYCLEIPQKPSNDDNTGGICTNKNLGVVKKIVIQNYSVHDILNKFKGDMEANSKQAQKSINFERLYQNPTNLRRVNSSPENWHLENNKFVSSESSSSRCQQSDFDMLQYKNNFNRTNRSSDTSISLNTFQEPFKEQPTSSNNTKKFNFKQKLTSNTSDIFSSNISANSQKENLENKHCDNIISCSQISIKPDSKEHTEIWKNLLQDIDADSLFGDF